MDQHSELTPSAMYAELAMFLRTSGSTLSPTEAIVRALKEWMQHQREAAAPVTGYQWKCLFLPSGTRLRLRCADQLFYAEVIGDDIIYRERAVSPRRMVLAAAGEPRNAWRELWLRRPQDREWMQADRLRREQTTRRNNQQAAPPSPTEAIQLAARSMSEALQTALLLVDQSRQRAEQQVERRLPKHRRRDDQLDGDCLMD